MRQLTAFLRLFYLFSLRHLLRHRGRALTVLAGIALGAAVFTSVRLSVDASLASFANTVDRLAGKADRVVLADGGGVPETLVAELLRHPALRAAAPVMSTYVRPSTDPERSFRMVGIDPILDRPLRAWEAEDRVRAARAAWVRGPARSLLPLPETSRTSGSRATAEKGRPTSSETRRPVA
jgi:putative ABC transport system permease protein